MVVSDRLQDLAKRSVLLQDWKFRGTRALIFPLSRSGRKRTRIMAFVTMPPPEVPYPPEAETKVQAEVSGL